MRNEYIVFVRKPHVNRPLWRTWSSWDY